MEETSGKKEGSLFWTGRCAIDAVSVEQTKIKMAQQDDNIIDKMDETQTCSIILFFSSTVFVYGYPPNIVPSHYKQLI